MLLLTYMINVSQKTLYNTALIRLGANRLLQRPSRSIASLQHPYTILALETITPDVKGEAELERHDAFKELDLLRGERDSERFDVRLQVLYLATADDREDVGRLQHEVGDSDCRNGSTLERSRYI